MTTNTVPLTEATAIEAERAAYASGRTREAALLARIAELEAALAQAQDDLEDAETNSLASWEHQNGPADAYRDFFFECFQHLPQRYPAPSVESDYDQAVIFDAIARP